ncbi:hypothetical protein ACFPOG_12690 [Paenibacillus aestuarii]|uniref:Uncharacterized protein n=1 Tax=Paenibacillus aestuarii TaxID=516965 RepID=A0ABW0K8K3_9BACL
MNFYELGEVELVKEYTLLHLLLSVFERDAKLLEQTLKTPAPYLELIQQSMDKVTGDLTRARKEMKRREMKIIEDKKTPDALQTKYLVKGGYHREINLLLSIIKPEIEVRMHYFLQKK